MNIETITPSSGNVFTDLGFSDEEATLLKMRADLMAHLRTTIESKGWTQTVAAKTLGVSQARISDLVRGKWDKFSLDMLVSLLVRSGQHCELSIA
ncbi:MAG: helix-turn-helix transcriptional regulator [Formosimonas sp.]